LTRALYGRQNQSHRTGEISADDRGLRKAIIEERKKGLSEARIEMMLDCIETENARKVDPETLELLMSELTATAKATHEGSDTVQ
jgi:hypothetical protein